jgi:amino acid transporter
MYPLQGILSVLMLFAGDVYTLINYATFVEVLSFFMSAAGLLWLRYKQPNAHRPIKVSMKRSSGDWYRRCLILTTDLSR